MEGVSEAEGYLKIAVLAACVIKGLFPLLQGEDVGDHAVGFQVPLPDVLNHKGVGIGAQVGAQNIQLLPVADNGKVQGALISFDPNLRPPLWPSLEDAARQIREGLALCDILKIADNEIEFITGEKDFDRAAGMELFAFRLQDRQAAIGICQIPVFGSDFDTIYCFLYPPIFRVIRFCTKNCMDFLRVLTEFPVYNWSDI